uniref:Uncharacterized protein n=1 Tax=Castor canadensis TaxID=51338 RepID=A0A8C0WNV4_CASCN
VGEQQDAGRDVQVGDGIDGAQKECGGHAGGLGLPPPPPPPAHHGVHQRPVAVLADGHHQEDADKQIGLDDSIDHTAEEASKGPVELVPDILCPEGQTQDKHQIRSCQIGQVDFCHAALVQAEDAEDKDVLQRSQQEQDPEERGLGGIDPFQPLGVRAVVL